MIMISKFKLWLINDWLLVLYVTFIYFEIVGFGSVYHNYGSSSGTLYHNYSYDYLII
jgi:hypothetical protein